MKKEKLYIEFENLAEKLGLRVIKGKGDFQGGSCIIKDEKVIVNEHPFIMDSLSEEKRSKKYYLVTRKKFIFIS